MSDLRDERIQQPQAFGGIRTRLGAVEAFSRSLFQALFVDGTSPLDDALWVTLAHQAGVDPGEFRRAIDRPEAIAYDPMMVRRLRRIRDARRRKRTAGRLGIPL